MIRSSRSDNIRRYYAAYETKNRQVVEALLTDGFTFTSPYDDEIDRAEYFAKCWKNGETIRSITVEKIAEQGDAAFVLYKLVTTRGDEFRNTELLRFDGDKVSHVDVYFGATYRGGVFVKQQQ